MTTEQIIRAMEAGEITIERARELLDALERRERR